MNRNDRILYAVTAVSAAAALLLVLTLLPSEISLSFSSSDVKSSWYLVLLTLLPLFSTFLIASTDKSRLISAAVIAVADGYALLVIMQALGADVNFSAVVLLVLALLSLFIALAIRSGKLKAKPAWVTTEEAGKKAAGITALLFFLLSAEFFIMALLVLLRGVNGGFVIVPVLITAALFLLILARKTI